MEPTEEAYAELRAAYEFFNHALFEDRLPPCLITLQRKRRTYGFFCNSRFENRNGALTDEIAMNPEFFSNRSTKEVMGTLVHEMVHLWQAHFGKPGRSRYHNVEWGRFMETIGLVPSNTGQPGGKRTGDQMTHYPVIGGAFDQAAELLLTKQFNVSWFDRTPQSITPGIRPKNRSNREKFHCPQCGVLAWGKPSLTLRCGVCAGYPRLIEPD